MELIDLDKCSYYVLKRVVTCTGQGFQAKPDGPRVFGNTVTHINKFKNFKYHETYWKYNYLPQLSILNNKKQMYLTLKAFTDKYGVREFPYLPTTFLLPDQMKAFRRTFKKMSNKLWILKVVSYLIT